MVDAEGGRLRVSPQDFAMLCKGRLIHSNGRPLGTPSIDSRTIQAGQSFFALHGPNFNGHDFLECALMNGAETLVISEAFDAVQNLVTLPYDASIVSVPSTEEALQHLGGWYRTAFDGTVFGITGSSGKTTTKEMLKVALSPHGQVAATLGNLNNHLGVPLSLSQLHTQPAFGVFEMGMSAPGEIMALAKLVRPMVGIITSIGEAHLAGVGSLQGVARAKGELFEVLTEDAIAICPSQVPYLGHLISIAGDRLRTVGSREDDFCRILDVHPNGGRSNVTFRMHGRDHQLDLPCEGLHHVHNALCAVTSIDSQGFDVQASLNALTRFELPTMRGEVVRLSPGCRVVLDCYNANPQSMRAAVSAHLANAEKRPVLVLGDMLELGDHSDYAHRELAVEVSKISTSVQVFAVGEAMKAFVDSAYQNGFASSQVHWFDNADDAGVALLAQIVPEMNILIKGSRSLRLERVWDHLKTLGVDS